jgi:tetratricopeptide (TPR) repeat protein
MEAYHHCLQLNPHYLDARLGVVATRRQLAESRDAPRRVWPDMRTGLHEILAMDDTCYRARYWLASLQISHDYDWEKGMAGYDQLIGLNPADHLAWALYHRWRGRWEAARHEQTLAEQAYPLDTTVLDHAAAARYVERDYRGCLRQSQHASSVRPDLGLGASYWVARASIELGEYGEALAAIGQLRQVEPIPELLALEGRVYALMGQPGKAHEVLAQLERQSSYVSPYFVAWVHAALDDKTAALAALERSYTDRSERLVNSDYGGLRTDPAWDGLRDDPRFEALCQKVGLGKDHWPK